MNTPSRAAPRRPGATPEVEELLQRVHLIDVLGRENVFVAHATILDSTKQSLDRALDYVKEKQSTAPRQPPEP